MGQRFNPLWNSHYNFDDPANQAEIEAVERYCLWDDSNPYTPAQIVESPWGHNHVIEARHAHGEDFCLKQITLLPGHMLSLQRHRGRRERWQVIDGVLIAIVNGELKNVSAGHSVILPRGSVHCMINMSDTPVIVRETQRGICREKDNIRLFDANNRPTYPLTSEIEYQSAELYSLFQKELAQSR